MEEKKLVSKIAFMTLVNLLPCDHYLHGVKKDFERRFPQVKTASTDKYMSVLGGIDDDVLEQLLVVKPGEARIFPHGTTVYYHGECKTTHKVSQEVWGPTMQVFFIYYPTILPDTISH